MTIGVGWCMCGGVLGGKGGERSGGRGGEVMVARQLGGEGGSGG